MTETAEIYLTTAQVATRYGVTRGRICQLIWLGIPARKWGRDWQIREADLAQVVWPQGRPGRQPGLMKRLPRVPGR